MYGIDGAGPAPSLYTKYNFIGFQRVGITIEMKHFPAKQSNAEIIISTMLQVSYGEMVGCDNAEVGLFLLYIPIIVGEQCK